MPYNCAAAGCESTTADMKCTRCSNAHYCNEFCQRADWGRHKLLCRKVAVGAASTPAPVPRPPLPPPDFSSTDYDLEPPAISKASLLGVLCMDRVANVLISFFGDLRGGGLGEGGPSSDCAYLPLRVACKALCNHVTAHATGHASAPFIIRRASSLATWRKCFPKATHAAVQQMMLKDDEVRYFSGVKTLNLTGAQITDRGLVHLDGVRELDITGCQRVTGAGFVHLRGIRKLTAHYDNLIFTLNGLAGVEEVAFIGNWGLQDDALRDISGVKRLSLIGCCNITDAGLAHLAGVQDLDISECSKITGSGFVHIKGVKRLVVNTLRGEGGFQHLAGIEELSVSCDVSSAAFKHLTGIKRLYLTCCDGFTNSCVKYLPGIERLGLEGCDSIDDRCLKYLDTSRLKWLLISDHMTAKAVSQLQAAGVEVEGDPLDEGLDGRPWC